MDIKSSATIYGPVHCKCPLSHSRKLHISYTIMFYCVGFLNLGKQVIIFVYYECWIFESMQLEFGK